MERTRKEKKGEKKQNRRYRRDEWERSMESILECCDIKE